MMSSLRLAAAAGLAVSVAFSGLFARRGKHLSAIAPFGGFSAVGAFYFVVEFFYEFFKTLFAVFANVL